MLETYMMEIIAALVILILIVVYFTIQKSKQKEKDIFESKPPVLDTKEPIEIEEIQEEIVQKETKPIIMQEKTETIDFTALSGEEEGSFENEKVEEAISQPIVRKKRDVPPHGKITKDSFKKFAGQKILIAEDNLINQKVLTGLLVNSGIELKIADDGQIALDILKEESDYNFILMDAHMPRVDGFEATREIRKNPAYNHIVIIALSGDTASDDIRKMVDAGMEEQLEKPLRIESLYDILYAYTQKGSIDDTSLDTEDGLAVCGYDESFYHEILDEFVATYAGSKDRLEELFKAHDIEEADRYLLDLIGITANIGATNISKIILDLKESLNDPQERRYLSLFNEYSKSLTQLLRAIQNYKN